MVTSALSSVRIGSSSSGVLHFLNKASSSSSPGLLFLGSIFASGSHLQQHYQQQRTRWFASSSQGQDTKVGDTSSASASGYSQGAEAGDRILKSFTPGFRLALLDNTQCTKEAMTRHKLSFSARNNNNNNQLVSRNMLAVDLLGRMMAGASLMASFLKGEERISLELKYGNTTDDPFRTSPIDSAYAEAIRVGEVRAHVNIKGSHQPVHPQASSFTVNKILYNHATPVTSCVPLKQGDVSSDLQEFYDVSEQNPTLVSLETKLDSSTGEVLFSGGFLLQAFPDHKEQMLKLREKIVSEIMTPEKPLSHHLQELGMDGFANLLLLGDKTKDGTLPEEEQRKREYTEFLPVAFKCRFVVLVCGFVYKIDGID